MQFAEIRMESSREDSRYVNITQSANLEYEEVELKERKDVAEKIQVEEGSQIALTSATPQKVDRVKQNSHGYEIPSVAAADCTIKHLVVLVVILGLVSIVALVLSLVVITGVVGPKRSCETKGNWSTRTDWSFLSEKKLLKVCVCGKGGRKKRLGLFAGCGTPILSCKLRNFQELNRSRLI